MEPSARPIPGAVLLDKSGRPFRGFGGTITIYPDRQVADDAGEAFIRTHQALPPLRPCACELRIFLAEGP